jgi:hypothetical protein
MRKASLISLCILMLGAVYALAQRPQPAAVIIPTWEYFSQTFNDGQFKAFDNIGAQGWELVAVTPQQTVGNQVATYVAYFKRARGR